MDVGLVRSAIHNQVDRFDLVIDVIDRVPKLQGGGAHLKEWFDPWSLGMT
jgi:phosphoketolase